MGGTPFHHTTYDYSHAEWDGLQDHERNRSMSFNWLRVLLHSNFMTWSVRRY